MWSAAISQAIVVVLLGLLFRWLQQRLPAPELTDRGPSLEELKSKYQVWDLIVVIGNIMLWFPMAALVFAGLYPWVTWYSSRLRDNPETFVFVVDRIVCLIIPSFLVGILLSAVVMAGICKLFLRERFAEYVRYDNLRLGIDQRRVMKGTALILGVSCTLAVFWMLNVYLVATPTELRINRPFGWARRYSYSELTEVMTAPASIAKSGRRVPGRKYRLQFQDGTFYSTLFMPSDELGGRSQKQLIEAILERSGLTLQEKPVFEQGELEF